MLQRIQHDNGVVSYQSPLLRDLRVRHAFSTRLGGVSGGPYATLNLGSLAKAGPGDDNQNVAENFRRLRRALGCRQCVRVEARQVHGSEVWSPPARPIKPADAPRADALITEMADKLLVIRTADCVAVLLARADGGAVAAVHAGWRGVVAGVVPAAVRKLEQDHDAPPGRLIAAVGPAIGGEAFEVGPEVAEAFAAARLERTVRRTAGRPHVDLREAVLLQLERVGVRRDRIDRTDRCTYRDAGEFFSHRRDVTHHGQAGTGRMAAVIAPAAGA